MNMVKSLVIRYWSLGIRRKQLAVDNGSWQWAGGRTPEVCTGIKLALTSGVGKVIFFLFLLCPLAFSPKLVFAGASVSVTGNTWAIGTKAASFGTTSSSYTVTNNNSGGTEDIEISVGNSANWTPSATTSPGINQFVLQLTNGAGAVITGAYTRLVSGLANNGTSPFTLYFTTPTAGSTQGSQTITVTLTATNWVDTFVCGTGLAVTHTYAVGGPAPVTKTVTYGTVLTGLSGTSQCWITQNLGATTYAASVSESTEPNAGWYWQFNRIQGYKYDTSLIPSSPAWDATNDNTYTNWDPAKDPCTLLLGTGWRLPTSTEWTNADANGQVGGWDNYNETFADVLKLHAAGYLDGSFGTLANRGSSGFYWSSTQYSATDGWYLVFGSSVSYMYYDYKAYGFSVRCLKD